MAGIRFVVICVFRDGNRILVAPGHDDVKNERFFRPLGGAVEFGELAEEALHREIREELDREIENVVQLGVIENRFEYRGQPGHEVVFVFDASFVDRGVYSERTVTICEAGWDGPAEWLVLREPLPAPLYPAGLLGLVQTVATISP
jgi:ADP-ribose pyrophosphatase YjhB (NUDIX family)